MVAVGMFTGHIDRTELRMQVADVGFQMMTENPELFDLVNISRHTAVATPEPTGPKPGSLAALRARQQASAQPELVEVGLAQN